MAERAGEDERGHFGSFLVPPSSLERTKDLEVPALATGQGSFFVEGRGWEGPVCDGVEAAPLRRRSLRRRRVEAVTPAVPGPGTQPWSCSLPGALPHPPQITPMRDRAWERVLLVDGREREDDERADAQSHDEGGARVRTDLAEGALADGAEQVEVEQRCLCIEVDRLREETERRGCMHTETVSGWCESGGETQTGAEKVARRGVSSCLAMEETREGEGRVDVAGDRGKGMMRADLWLAARRAHRSGDPKVVGAGKGCRRWWIGGRSERTRRERQGGVRTSRARRRGDRERSQRRRFKVNRPSHSRPPSLSSLVSASSSSRSLSADMTTLAEHSPTAKAEAASCKSTSKYEVETTQRFRLSSQATIHIGTALPYPSRTDHVSPRSTLSGLREVVEQGLLSVPCSGSHEAAPRQGSSLPSRPCSFTCGLSYVRSPAQTSPCESSFEKRGKQRITSRLGERRKRGGEGGFLF